MLPNFSVDHSILIMFIGKVLQIYKQALSGCCYLCDQHIRLETNVHFLLLLFITGYRMQKIIISVGFVEEMINWSLQMLSSYCYSSILRIKLYNDLSCGIFVLVTLSCFFVVLHISVDTCMIWMGLEYAVAFTTIKFLFVNAILLYSIMLT